MSGSYRLVVRVLGVALAIFSLLVAPVGFAFAQTVDATVEMQGVSFVPNTVHITPGQTVQWVNTSPLQHTVTADDGSFDSAMVDPNGTFSMSFDSPGAYKYFCQPHGAAGLQGMSGTIVVDDPDAEDVNEMAAPATVQAAPIQPALVRPDEYYPDH